VPPSDWRLRVEDMLDAMTKIDRYISDLDFERFGADPKTIDAVVRNLEIMGEAARHLLAGQDALPAEIPWTEIASLRNVLVHEYFGVDIAIIWHTVTRDLPPLRVPLQRLIQ
jgi:uncharacterized protein with HEPN domain